MSEVIRILPGFGERSPDAMLECAKSADLDGVVIIGWSGDNFFFSTSYESDKDVLWDLKVAQAEILGV